MRTFEEFPTNQWHKIATSVIKISLEKPEGYGEFKYYLTTRMINDPDPSSDRSDDGLSTRILNHENYFVLSGTNPVNVFLWAEKESVENKLAAVKVDL